MPHPAPVSPALKVPLLSTSTHIVHKVATSPYKNPDSFHLLTPLLLKSVENVMALEFTYILNMTESPRITSVVSHLPVVAALAPAAFQQLADLVSAKVAPALQQS